MAEKIQLGAINVETSKYEIPAEALKGKEYKCVDCDERVILRKGTVRRPHFAHYAATNCEYYDHPNESQIHKDAKMLMAKLLTEKRSIQFCWDCDYEGCNVYSDTCAFSEVPTIIYKDGDEVVVEYRSKDNKWVADVALVNNGEPRYIIEILNTHRTTTPRPEPWFEVDALRLIEQVNERYSESKHKYDLTVNDSYIIGCHRTDIVRYCYGSFCWKESWTKKIPGYDENLFGNACILCKTTKYEPVCDGDTGKFQNGFIKVCVNCLFEDSYKKRIRKLYATPCYGNCFRQGNAHDVYIQKKCPDNCKLIACPKCHKKHPKWILDHKGGVCLSCDVDNYIANNHHTFIDVSFSKKEEAKSLGARWDPLRKKWYIQKDAKNKAFILTKFKEIPINQILKS